MRQLLDGFVPGLSGHAVATILGRADGMPAVRGRDRPRPRRRRAARASTASGYRPIGELGELAVPDTLRSLIASAARRAGSDRPQPRRRCLRPWSDLHGRPVSWPIGGQTDDVSSRRLQALVRRELFDVEIDPRSSRARPVPASCSRLIREVAYGTLAKRERRARHLAAARYFESLGDEELAGALASHYLAAHEASAEGVEADAVAIQARLALAGAADRAAMLGAHEQAVSYLRQATAITTDLSERASLELRAATSANAAAAHPMALELARTAIDDARAAGDPPAVAAGESLLGEILIDAGQPHEAVAALEAALGGSSVRTDDEAQASLLGNLSRAYMRAGRPADAIETADRALDLAEHLHLDRVIAETFNNKGSSLGYLGRQLEGVALLQAAVDLAHDRGFVAAEIRALANLSASGDDARRSKANDDLALDLARRVGNRTLANWASTSSLFMTFVLAEGWETALADAAKNLAEVREHASASPLDEVRSLAVQALMRVPRGEPTDALLAELETLEGQTSDAYAPAAVHQVRGDRAMLAGDYAEAAREMLLASDEPNIGEYFIARAVRAAIRERDPAKARELADRLDAHPASTTWIAAARMAARSGIDALEGRPDEALAGYRAALDRYRSVGQDWELACTGLDLVMLLGADVAAARLAGEEARVIFERVGAGPYLEQIDALLGPRPAGSVRLADAVPGVTAAMPG